MSDNPDNREDATLSAIAESSVVEADQTCPKKNLKGILASVHGIVDEKKVVKWKADHELVRVKYFDVEEEEEKTNVNLINKHRLSCDKEENNVEEGTSKYTNLHWFAPILQRPERRQIHDEKQKSLALDLDLKNRLLPAEQQMSEDNVFKLQTIKKENDEAGISQWKPVSSVEQWLKLQHEMAMKASSSEPIDCPNICCRSACVGKNETYPAPTDQTLPSSSSTQSSNLDDPLLPAKHQTPEDVFDLETIKKENEKAGSSRLKRVASVERCLDQLHHETYPAPTDQALPSSSSTQFVIPNSVEPSKKNWEERQTENKRIGELGLTLNADKIGGATLAEMNQPEPAELSQESWEKSQRENEGESGLVLDAGTRDAPLAEINHAEPAAEPSRNWEERQKENELVGELGLMLNAGMPGGALIQPPLPMEILNPPPQVYNPPLAEMDQAEPAEPIPLPLFPNAAIEWQTYIKSLKRKPSP